MGYLFLALALTAGVIKAYCGKKTSSFIVFSSDSMIMNLLRMSLCIAIGFFLVAVGDGIGGLYVDATSLLSALLSGLSTAAFVVTWLLSVKSGAYMMVEVFLLIGVSVPITLCRILFDEKIAIFQIAGLVLLIVAVYIMCTYNSKIKGKMTIGSLLLLFAAGISNGLSDFSAKLFVKMSPGGSAAVFNFYTYVFAAIALLFAAFVFRKIDKNHGLSPRKPTEVIKPIWIYVVIMAACLFAYSFFKTRAAEYLNATELYPLSQGSSVVLSLLMASIIFKEKVNSKCIVGIILSFIALLFINLDFSFILDIKI